ncbi:MAG: hypothetical protein R2875_16850 [Desulfobacterales bacterium]
MISPLVVIAVGVAGIYLDQVVNEDLHYPEKIDIESLAYSDKTRTVRAMCQECSAEFSLRL